MRRKSLLNLIFGLLLFAGVGVSNAQQLTLMQYSNQWRYLITNAMPAGWSASNYPAANGWPQGAGVLAFPLAEAMPAGVPAPLTVLATNYNSTIVTSFYFRTSITLTSNPNSLSITGLAVIDDGGVLYVNGREIAPRVRMPAGTLTYFTLANAGGEVNGRPVDQIPIASSNFVQGVNVIAAEVHQDAHTSSDVVFGLSLVADVLAPPTIVTHPQSQTVDAGRNATFSVVATGTTPLTYRWYSNSVLVATSGGTSYTTPITTLAMNGTTYFVTVSNRFGLVQSSNAVLTVELDNDGPQMILGVNITTSSNQLEVTFNEAILQPPATNVLNWAVFVLGTTNSLTVTNAQWGTTRVRVFTREALNPSSNYVVCAYNMQDGKTNTTPQTCIGLGFAQTVELIGFGEVWRFNDNQWMDAAAPTNAPANVDWKQINFNDDPLINWMWAESAAPFRDDQNPTMPLCEVRSPTSIFHDAITYYFRKRFVINQDYGTNAAITLRYNVDDAAVFYLNGTEILRMNLPTGPLSYGTRASSCVEGPCQTSSLNNIGSLLRSGTNVLAVELHNCTEAVGQEFQTDATFDAELNVSYRNPPIVPRMGIARLGNSIILTWTGQTNIWRIEQATNLAGPWLPVTTPRNTNRLSTPWLQGAGPRFYRLKNP